MQWSRRGMRKSAQKFVSTPLQRRGEITRVEEAFEDQRRGLGKLMQDEMVVRNGALRPRAIVSSFKSGGRRSREHSARAWEVLQQIALRFPFASRVVRSSCEATED